MFRQQNWYAATYRAGDHWFVGKFMPHTYELRGNDWLFRGSFELELSELPAA